jgi:hypothetical protein
VRLPNNEIGVSDLLAYRECPSRFAWQMRRHNELPPDVALEPGERDDPPENIDWRNAYGLAVHDAIGHVERGLSHEDAAELTMRRYGVYLDVEDVVTLADDLDVYERRRPLGVTLVGAELELRAPLFIAQDGRQIFFRGRIDVLQRLIDNPSVFVMRDYKSSRWQKSESEIHADPQLWAYNWLVHEYYPECSQLIQIHDQLRFGETRTTKNAEQRRQIKAWLVAMAKLVLSDEVLKPKLNRFCAYCPIAPVCREPRRAVSYTRGLLATMAPLTSEGRRIKVEFARDGDTVERLIADELPMMMDVRKHIERVEAELKDAIRRMPAEDRERLGWQLKERHTRAISPEGLRELHARMGDTFYLLASLPITRLEELYGRPTKSRPASPELEIAREWMVDEVAGVNVLPAKSGE